MTALQRQLKQLGACDKALEWAKDGIRTNAIVPAGVLVVAVATAPSAGPELVLVPR